MRIINNVKTIMNTYQLVIRNLKQAVIVGFAVWFSMLTPVAVLAQEAVDAVGDPTGAPTDTGAPAATGTPEEETGAPEICTGNGCGQGEGQGAGQGENNGGDSLADLGGYIDENGNEVLPEGTVDTRQGADQGTAQGASQGSGTDLSGTNSNTGADSTNTVDAGVTNTATTSVDNTATNNTNVDAAANTGANTANKNTGSASTTTGNAGIGVTQLVNDNTTAINGNVGLNVTGYQGDYQGDLVLDFNNALALLTGGEPTSIRAINDTTGADSNNEVILSTVYEELNEIQNDGNINNQLDLSAITGQNEASMNTGDGSIYTGDANIAATLVNLLNTTVLNGNLTVAVQDIFGDLLGDIVIPDLSQLASAFWGNTTQIDASNDTTGSDSTNEIDIALIETEQTNINNDAQINTQVNANAITGQNDTLANTGGGEIDTGDASVSASNVSVANTTVEGGNWGLVIVNALNRWVGFLVGDSGEVHQLTQDETLREIEARNSATGADSTNTIDITDETNITNNIDNLAVINNEINADAITGQNEASKNTGQGRIATGDANILASAVNLANTTVKNANLGIAVVNIFGNWLGDLMYGGNALLAGLTDSTAIGAETSNNNTGSDSDNSIDISYDRSRETNIDNNADITTTLNANVDTGNNRANRNTNGGDIETGEAYLGLHSRAIANITGISLNDGGLAFNIEGGNDTTGFDSQNRITARVNDERIISIDNDANVSTVLPATVNTGNNEASQNTIGGGIDTGNIDADVSIHNLVNRVVLAIGDDVALAGNGGGVGLSIGADLYNAITGAKSENSNIVEAVRKVLASILDNAVIDNIVDMIFNTGGNESNQNTLAEYSGQSEPAAATQSTEQPSENEAPDLSQDDSDNTLIAAAVGGPENSDDNDGAAAGSGSDETTDENDDSVPAENGAAAASDSERETGATAVQQTSSGSEAVSEGQVAGEYTSQSAQWRELSEDIPAPVASEQEQVKAGEPEKALSLSDLAGSVKEVEPANFITMPLMAGVGAFGALLAAIAYLARRRSFQV